MKSTTVAILIFLIFVQFFNKGIILLQYELNKNYIITNLCENKNKPSLHCNGKCQLSKKLAQHGEEPGNAGNKIAKLKIQETFFTINIFDPSLQINIPASGPFTLALTQSIPSSYHPDVFRPPCA